MTPEEVLATLGAGLAEDLRGAPEDERVECKSAPYRLTEEAHLGPSRSHRKADS